MGFASLLKKWLKNEKKFPDHIPARMPDNAGMHGGLCNQTSG
jgi:hypothetical protein